MKKIAFYHIYLTNDLGTWSLMFLDQFKLLEDVGLLEELDAVYITAIGEPKSFAQLKQLANTYNGKLQIVNEISRDFKTDKELLSNINSIPIASENITTSLIKRTAHLNEDFLCFYFHTKGVTAVENCLNNGNAIGLKNYYYWRKFLEWGTIEQWQECLKNLKQYDIVGVNYQQNPAPHFSGAFWWAKSSYIKTLSNPWENDWWLNIQENTKDQWLKTAPIRFKDEMWICSNPNAKIHSIKNINGVVNNNNLSMATLPRKLYLGENK